jgi:hypothetical protein
MAATAAVVAVVGAGYTAYASYKSGKVNQQIAEVNAKTTDFQAKDAVYRGEIEEDNLRLQVRKLIGAQRASYAGQGVDVNEGSADIAQQDTAYLGELDALTIRNNAAREAYGYRTESFNQRAGGSLAAAQGRNQAFTTLLTGGYTYWSSGGAAAVKKKWGN